MPTQIIETPQVMNNLTTFSPTEAAIASLAEQYLPLTIQDVADKEGYQRVRAARLDIKNKRCDVEKRRKELKEESLRYGRAVDARAKELTLLLEPIETHLAAEEAKHARWRDEIKRAAEIKREAEERRKREEEAARLKAAQEAENGCSEHERKHRRPVQQRGPIRVGRARLLDQQ